jgi:hypothetical protein
MNCNGNLTCTDDARLNELMSAPPPVNGIATLEVLPHPFGSPLYEREVRVYFYRNFPPALLAHPEAFKFTGGERIPGSALSVVHLSGAGKSITLRLNQAGDFSDYTLTISHPNLDPVFNCYVFNFQVDCPRIADCCTTCPPSPPPQADPAIDYLAKDYNSFLRALLDFLPTRVPTFTESSEADIAVTIAELFAYVGDQLSYYQDAVSNEAWLSTARQRLSAKRHARLLDYRMHDGLAARTVLCFNVVIPTTIPQSLAVSTGDPDPARRIIFETDEGISCWPELTEIQPWSWLGTDCCLPPNATQAELAGDFPQLAPGQLFLIEEVLGPVANPDGTVTWAPEAADPKHRQVVRLTRVTSLQDSLAPGGAQKVTRVHWRDEDALTWSACIMAQDRAVVVFRGNLARASHGQTVANETIDSVTMTLAQGPLTWLYNGGQSNPPWNWLFPPDTINPRDAFSSVRLTVNGVAWNEQESLLSSQANDSDFVVDTDDQGRGILRFGDGQLGRQLPKDAAIAATYRIGNGTAGNVGSDSLASAVRPFPGGAIAVRNPLPAFGGTDAESIEAVRRDAPQAFAAVQYRAVTAQDYADAAKLVNGVDNAVAQFRWTGSWLTVFVAIDPVGRADLPSGLIDAVLAQLDMYRQAGYDLDIHPPDYVPLRIDLDICIEPNYFQADVLGDIEDVLSAGLRNDGSPGFFHPNSFTFGQSLYLSALIAAVQSVAGVRAVHVSIFRPLLRVANHEIEHDEITVGPFQILRLDNDPSRPENGVLNLTPEGGL